ncbi:MAG: carbonic anhydrase family protein [Bacteriovoracaceae bacterium]|nr:carbonic anhydrase family protein [Bacteriovoracaceae bacterium]
MKTLLFMLLFVSSAFAQSVEWGYSAPMGPAQWGSVANFSVCSLGASQSPIAITSGEVAGLSNVTPDNSLPPLNPSWLESPMSMVNNGHTIQVNYQMGSGLDFEGNSYNLKQFHFHSPSEHTLNLKQYPLEMHLVHSGDKGLLVVGIFFKEGAKNEELQKVWDKAPTQAGTSANYTDLISASHFMPASDEFFTYEGSLTTPPCTEGVRWVVMAQPIEASREQLQFLQKTMGFTNNRPLQSLDGRVINQENL